MLNTFNHRKQRQMLCCFSIQQLNHIPIRCTLTQPIADLLLCPVALWGPTTVSGTKMSCKKCLSGHLQTMMAHSKIKTFKKKCYLPDVKPVLNERSATSWYKLIRGPFLKPHCGTFQPINTLKYKRVFHCEWFCGWKTPLKMCVFTIAGLACSQTHNFTGNRT